MKEDGPAGDGEVGGGRGRAIDLRLSALDVGLMLKGGSSG